jgi:hypothetical protein
MKEIKIISQVVQDLARGSQNINSMTLRLGINYTAYTTINLEIGGA